MPLPILRGGTRAPTEIVRPDGRTTVNLGGVQSTVAMPTVGGRITIPQALAQPTTFGAIDQSQSPKSQSAKSGNLAARLELPDLQNPSLQPPVSIPQNNGQPQIALPEMYQQNNAGIYPPLTIRNGITMPSASPGVKPQTFPSMNWADFLTVAQNQNLR